jgi:hypothetical protein
MKAPSLSGAEPSNTTVVSKLQRGTAVTYKIVNVSRIKPGKQAEAAEPAKRMHQTVMNLGGVSAFRVFQVDLGGDLSGAIIVEFEFEPIGALAAWRESGYVSSEFRAAVAEWVDVVDMDSTQRFGMAELDLS